MELLIADTALRFVFVGGKGGVGKTTSSASIATCFAKRAACNRILLISTDPAHSLKDAFRQPFVPGKPTRVEGNYAGTLDVLEVDPNESLEGEVSHRIIATFVLFNIKSCTTKLK